MSHPDERRLGPVMELSEFVRVVDRRGADLSWFLGAGCSVSAGVPSAEQMILDFKRRLYSAEERVALDDLPLNDPSARQRLEQHFAQDSRFPPLDSAEEYAAYFEELYPNESDRRRYIHDLVSDATPSYGHIVLSALLAINKLNVIWTTNFDPIVEEATAVVLGSARRLRVATLAEPEVASRVIAQSDWPLLVKVHGDFQSERLKNTAGETRRQDEELRAELTEYLRRAGLIVVGYSGRDQSVMDVLTAALDAPRPYQAGLFWLVRRGQEPLPTVRTLIDAARSKGVDAWFVEVESFEELMSEVRLILELPQSIKDHLNRYQPPKRFSGFSMPPREGGWPAIKLNAIPVVRYPRTARLIRCRVGGTSEVRAAIREGDVEAIAVRRSDGVIAFGDDDDLSRAFAPFAPVELDYASIDPGRSWRQETADMGLLYDAIVHAIRKTRPVLVRRARGEHVLVVDPAQVSNPLLADLKKAVRGPLVGTVVGGNSEWAEAVRLRMEFRHGNLWLIYEPYVWSLPTDDEVADQARKNFVREKQVPRYNRIWNDMLRAWANVLTGGDKESWLTSIGTSDGVDATFVIKRLNAMARSM